MAAADYTEALKGTTVTFDMVAVTPDAASGLSPFWVSETEVTWDLFDAYIYRLDEPETAPGTDAVARPSKPYISMDRGYGHAGFPALSMSFHNAQTFCVWLSKRTGRHYRLPTTDEWAWLCTAGGIDATELDEHAWHRGNAKYATHPVGDKPADDLGLHDLHGNAGEWCVGPEGEGILAGGTYRDEPAAVGCQLMRPAEAKWNDSDPQIPKSIWWLADAPFVGLRVICDPSPRPDDAVDQTPTPPTHNNPPSEQRQ